jgi:hypothetical protein
LKYLGVGAGVVNVEVQPGPQQIPNQTFTFGLVSLEQKPGPSQQPPSPNIQALPAYFTGFTLSDAGQLVGVSASFQQPVVAP